MPQAAAAIPLLFSAAAPVAAGAGTAGAAAGTGAALGAGAAGAGAAGASAALPALASTTAAAAPLATTAAAPGILDQGLSMGGGFMRGLTAAPGTAPVTASSIPWSMSPAGSSGLGVPGLSPLTNPLESQPLAFRAGNLLRGQGGGMAEILKNGLAYKMLMGGQQGGAAPTITPIPVPPPMPIRLNASGMGGDPIRQLMMALQQR